MEKLEEEDKNSLMSNIAELKSKLLNTKLGHEETNNEKVDNSHLIIPFVNSWIEELKPILNKQIK